MPPKKKYEFGYRIKDKLTEERFVNGEMQSFIQKLDGLDVNVEYFQQSGFQNPIFVEKTDGLGLKMPPAGFNVDDVVRLLGGDRMLDAMDVRSQNGIKLSLGDFVKYFKLPKSERKSQLFNVLSLEFSKTKMDDEILAPEVVRQIDWIDLMWPIFLKDQQIEETNVASKMKYPKVQKYCLMSPSDCFTDFHIDLGGSSVWYHILFGEKIFWLIPPTDNNLQMFQRWTLSGRQNATFFGDLVEHCVRVCLKPGNTFFIPSGWIHAVYTPKDSLVIGGNFLHSFQIPMQLNVYEIETNTKVSERFRFPFFREILWYAIERYVFELTGRSYLKSELRPKNISTAPLMQIKNSISESAKFCSENSKSLSENSKSVPEPSEFRSENSKSLLENSKSLSESSEFRSENSEFSNPDKILAGGPPLLSEWECSGLAVLGDWLKANRSRGPQGIIDAQGLLKELGLVLEKLRIINKMRTDSGAAAGADAVSGAAAGADLNPSSSSSLPKREKTFSGVLVVAPQIRPSTGLQGAVTSSVTSVASTAASASNPTSASTAVTSSASTAFSVPSSAASASNSAEPPPTKRCKATDNGQTLQAERVFSIALGDQKAVSVIRYLPGQTQGENFLAPISDEARSEAGIRAPTEVRNPNEVRDQSGTRAPTEVRNPNEASDSLNVDTKTPPSFQPLPSVGCLSRNALTNDPFLSGLGNHFFVQWMMKQKK